MWISLKLHEFQSNIITSLGLQCKDFKKIVFFWSSSTFHPEGFSLNVGNGLLCKLMQLGIHQQEQDMDRWIVVGRFVNVRFGNGKSSWSNRHTRPFHQCYGFWYCWCNCKPTRTPGLYNNVILYVIVLCYFWFNCKHSSLKLRIQLTHNARALASSALYVAWPDQVKISREQRHKHNLTNTEEHIQTKRYKQREKQRRKHTHKGICSYVCCMIVAGENLPWTKARTHKLDTKSKTRNYLVFAILDLNDFGRKDKKQKRRKREKK